MVLLLIQEVTQIIEIQILNEMACRNRTSISQMKSRLALFKDKILNAMLTK